MNRQFLRHSTVLALAILQNLPSNQNENENDRDDVADNCKKLQVGVVDSSTSSKNLSEDIKIPVLRE